MPVNFDREDCYGIILECSTVPTSDSHHSAMNPGCLKKSLYIGIWFPEMCASQAC